MIAMQGSVLRWSVGDGSVALQDGGFLDESEVLERCPEVGAYELDVDGTEFTVERVGSRYCTVGDVIAYGRRNGDDFERFDTEDVMEAIQQAEEAIEAGCGRSFCKRAASVHVREGFNELPMQDVRSIEGAELVGDRQCLSDSAKLVRVVYGAAPSSRLRAACVKLAASIIRPRVGAENARGTSMDGVYISFTLADGTDGSWTGIPDVDAFIEGSRSRRRLVC